MPTETTTENKLLTAEIKVILTTYSVYVFKCMAAKMPMKDILTGDEWYDKIYKKQ